LVANSHGAVKVAKLKVLKLKNATGITVREVIAEVGKLVQEQGSPDGKYTFGATVTILDFYLFFGRGLLTSRRNGIQMWTGRRCTCPTKDESSGIGGRRTHKSPLHLSGASRPC
jgi:hypothetical protein